MKITIDQQQCRINSYHYVLDSKDAKILAFDTKDKYPSFAGTSEFEVFIELGQSSPSYESRKSKEYTRVILAPNNPTTWEMMTGETGRYTFYIILYKRRDPTQEPKGEWFNVKDK